MANTTQILVRNPVGDLSNHGDIHTIQRLTFSFNAYSETSETSDVMGIQFGVCCFCPNNLIKNYKVHETSFDSDLNVIFHPN